MDLHFVLRLNIRVEFYQQKRKHQLNTNYNFTLSSTSLVLVLNEEESLPVRKAPPPQQPRWANSNREREGGAEDECE